MKLSQLARLIKVNFKNNKQHKYLLGATLLILGGFFYSQNISAKSLENKNIISKKLISIPQKQNNIDIQNKNQSISAKSKISLEEIEKQVSFPIKTKSENTKITDDNLKDELTDILSGTPMENMIEPISKQNRTIAAFLVGIALKESQFGKHSPKLHGQDCYNYWGYRGKRARMGTGGHTCFDSPEDAVNTVSKRLETLVFKQHRTTPQKMLIWKCGNSCAKHSPASVAKWVADVSIYFNKLNS